MHPESLAMLAGRAGGTMMELGRSQKRMKMLMTVAAGALACASAARAADAPRQDYKLEADELSEALKSVSRQSGRDIIFTADAVSGKRAPRLVGSYTADEAVRTLLAGSGLTVEFRKDVILIRGRSEASGEIESGPTSLDILITGTRIRGAALSSPVVVKSRDEIELAGFANLGSYARSIPQNFSGGQNPNVQGGGSQGNNSNISSSSTINLRGLGPDATLTLLNGHRLSYDALAQGVDIAAIPLAAIERVEIIADGASALYGSDAVGGVANVILRSDFSGLETSVRVSASTDGGNAERQFSAVGGLRWTDGGGLVAIDHVHNGGLVARQRSYTAQLDDSASLLPRQKQISAVLAGHQQITQGLEAKFDGQFSERHARNDNPFFTTSPVWINGLRANPHVRSYSLTPSLKLMLGGDWVVQLSGTHGHSQSDLRSRRYASGAETKISLIYGNRLDTIELGGEGPLFHLPGGDLRLAVGAGYRSIGLDVYVATTNPAGTTNISSNYSTSRTVHYGYGEVSLPLVGAANRMALIRRLQLTGALRYEDYRGMARIATPKLGIVYDPIDAVTLKLSWGRSFKAPTLAQDHQIRQGILAAGSTFLNNPSGLPVLYFAGGGKALQPERAETLTATLALRPAFVDGLTIEASYFDVRYCDRVATPIASITSALGNPMFSDLIIYNPSAAQVLAAIDGLPQGLSNQSGSTFNPAAVSAIIDDSLQNVSEQRVRGADVTLSYRGDLGPRDRLAVTVSASYLESDRRLSAGQPALDLAGTIFDPPHWRATGTGTWTRDNIDLTLVGTFLGGTLDDRRPPYVRVGSFLSFDAIGRVKTQDGSGLFANVELTLSALNLFNRKPPAIANSDPAQPPYDSSNYPAAGRVIALGLRKRW